MPSTQSLSLFEWLEWQQQLHLSSIDLGLDRIRLVAENLELLSLPFPVITVAGTNGKGSSTAMLQSIYQQAGYKTGVYTSPHLLRYNERISINAISASDSHICTAFEAIDQARGEISLTYFEFATLAAVWLFVKEKVDLAILEVGLGGRLDAVNLWGADVALITTIAIDHESWLGKHREEIAIEKAGIMRRGKIVICGDLSPPSTIESEAKRIDAQLIQRNRDFSLSLLESLPPKQQNTLKQWEWHFYQQNISLKLPFPALKGQFQLDNAAHVIATIEQLQTQLAVPLEAMQIGLINTKLAGRLQTVSTCPQVLVDVAHNPQAAEQLALYLSNHPVSGKTVSLFSVLKDKDLAGIIAPFNGVIDQWCLISLDDERGCSAIQLQSQFEKLGINHTIIVNNNFKKAMQDIINTLECNDRLVVFGSFLLVSGVLESL